MLRSVTAAAALTLALALPATAAVEITSPQSIQGLTGITKRYHWYSLRRPKIYEYQLEDGSTFVSGIKLKHVKDLRDYEVQHPVWSRIQLTCARWEPVFGIISGVSNIAWAGSSKWRTR